MYRFSFCSPPPPSFSLLAVCASCEEKNILPINERVPRHLTQLKPFIIIWTCSSWSRGEREIYTYKTMSVAHADGIKPYYDGKIQTLRVSVCMLFILYFYISISFLWLRKLKNVYIVRKLLRFWNARTLFACGVWNVSSNAVFVLWGGVCWLGA